MEKLAPKDIETILSLAPLQEGMLFHYLKNPRSGLYFEQLCLKISGTIDAQVFEKAWNSIIENNEMLRTVFRWEKLEKPSQIILKEHKGNVIFYDLSDKNDIQKQTALEEIKVNDRRNAFDLQQVPFRVTLCTLAETQYEMVISNHHILYDGWSNGIILKEFFNVYHTLSKGKQALSLPTKLSFKEYVKWLQSRDRKKQEHFWREYLAGFETAAELPIRRKKEETTGAGDYSIILDEDIQRKLDILVKNSRVTLASIFYSAWGILLQRYCGSEDVVFGTTVSGRSANLKGIEDMVGLFINTIPLRINTYPGETIIEVIYEIDHVLHEREEFEHTPLVDIQSYSSLGGSGSLFDTLIVIENYPLDNHLVPECPQLSIHSYSMVETTHYDLTVGILPFNEIEIKFSFKQELFDKDTIVELAGHFKSILRNIIENPETALSQLEIISIEEKNRILYEFNNTTAEYPRAKTIHQLFVEQAEKTPDHIALVGAGSQTCPNTLSYRQLNEQSDQLAGLLMEKGVLPGSIVGIMMERSVEMVMGILGILKSGGGYLPIDTEYPQERIDYMLRDSGTKTLMKKSEIRISKSDTNPNKTNFGFRISNFNPSNIAYIIYTSGSTGKPKGVMIEHRSAVNLLFAMQNQYPFTPADTYLLKTAYTFDVSVTELFGWYMGGGKLAILEKHGEKDPQVILDCIQRHDVTYINFVPSMFNVFLDFVSENNKKQLNSLKYIFLAGEVLLPSQVKKFKDLKTAINLENLYGPTEGTVYSSGYSLSEWNGIDNVSIGKPLANIKLYILNSYNHLQPLGIPGELYISGEGVARGYLNNPELTCEKLKIINFLYCTGDFCKWLPDGNIEFLGRIDQQVKIRGFRIELGEIENRLLKIEQLKDAIVLAKEDTTGDKYLAAYFVSGRDIPGFELTEYLVKDLPDYMIPSYFTRLEKIPLTPSGKVDRKALPEPGLKAGETYVAPRDEMEMKLVEIWGRVLGKDLSLNPIGIDENFFRLGGHSLKATSLAAGIHKEFNVKIPLGEIFKRPTIRGLFAYLNDAVNEQYVMVEAVEKKEYYMLSSAQKRLYFLQQMDNAGAAYNISAAWVLDGELDSSKLEDTFIRLVQRHESFRTSFVIIGEEPVQRIHNKSFAKLFQKRLPEGPPEAIIKSFIRPFDLSQPPLMRVGLVRLEAGRHLLLVDMHHIISDGISTEILVREFTALYQSEELPAINLQYKDYAEWQRHLKQAESFSGQKSYWKKEFEGEIPVLELPGDYARPAVQSFEGNRITFAIGSETVETVNSFALETGTTLYMVLWASYSIFLAKLSGQEDIIIGTPAGGRRYADFEKIIGVFVNTLVLRSYPAGEKSLIEFLGEIKERALGAFENQDYQYEDLVEALTVPRDAGRNPLFDVMFVLQNMGSGEIEIPGLKLTSNDLENKTSKFDLTLTAVEIKGKLEFTFEYCTKLFKQETIERFITYFKTIVFDILEDKGKCLSEIEMIPVEEKNWILSEFNNTAAEYPAEKTIHQLFVEQVGKTPDHIALVGADSQICPITLSYRQLNRQSDRLAGLLIEKGVLADNIVGIMMERSVEMIAGILGILKSGGAYMPIDPDYPQERINYMLKDSTAKLLVNEKFFGGSRGAVLQKSPSCSANLAYIIYTSGTTGQPKGSLIEHRNVVRLLFNDKFQFDFNDRDVWTLFHSFCFDFSVWEMYGALLYGGKLLIVPKMVARDTAEFLELLNREAVTVLNQTPSAFYNLINETLTSHRQEKKLYIKYVIFGGEALNPLKLKNWLEKYPRTRLINMFGITETTVHVTYKEITQEDVELNTGNIGKPIPTLKVYISDRYLKQVPIGGTGEICVGGDGVARGYLNRPELTAEKFISHSPLTTHHSPIYRSGDLARFLANGDIEYLGRIDHQIKIRGFRIELGEIENRLIKYDGIKDAVVLVGETAAEKYLCTYIVSHREFTIKDLRTYLAGTLPEYMIPSYFVRLERIPLTPNGKIDRKALPGVHDQTGLWEEAASPTTETEEKLAGLWETVLGIQPGINVDFFHSGGDSIKAVRVVNSINSKLSTNLKIAHIYLNGTIKKLASIIDRDKTGHALTDEELRRALAEIEALKNRVMTAPGFPVGIEDVYPMSDIQEGMAFHSLKEKEAALYHDQMVYQPVIKNFNPGILKKAFTLMAGKHPILRTAFDLKTYEVPVQLVYRQIPHDIVHENISHMEKEEQEDYLLQFLAEDRKKVFQLDIPPLWRLRIFDLGNDNICVVLVAHHAILDGWSVASLDTELLNTYWQLLAKPEFTPVILKNTYKAFILEQAVEKKRDDAADFWRNELDGYKRLELPNPLQNDDRGNKVERYRYSLGKDLLSKLKGIAKTHQITLKSLCFSAYIYMFNMLSYENEIVAGLVTNNRPLCEDGDKILGCFLNTIPVRIIIPANISWLDYIRLVDEKLLELKKYERIPLFEIVRIMGENAQNGNPIFDVLFNYIDFHVLDQIQQDYGKNHTGKLQVEEKVTTNTAFDFSVSGTQGNFELIISYSESFFNEKIIGDLCLYFEAVLNKFIVEPGSTANKSELLPTEEKHQLLYKFNDTAEEYPKDKTIHQLFEEQAARTPDRIALVGPVGLVKPVRLVQLTYLQLNEQSDRLAGLLIEKGVVADNIVGIMGHRSLETITTILGILKSGSAYMPIDPAYPQERVDYMLKDSNAKVLIINKSEIRNPKLETNSNDQKVNDQNENQNFGAVFVLNFENLDFDIVSNFEFRASNFNLPNLAYIIYTSGSTGSPKGVMVEHRNVVRLVKNTNYISFENTDRILQSGALEFDASTFEIWGALLNGLTLYVAAKEELLDPGRLKKAIRNYDITMMWMTSPLFNQMLQEDSEIFKGLKNLLVGGDVLSPSHINRLRSVYPRLNVINGYGPTENTTFSTTFLICREYHTNIPIGKPINNSTAYIIDKYHHLQPIGIPGELVVGGDGVARGYLNNPELTTERFILPSATRGAFEKAPAGTDPAKLSLNYDSPLTTHHSPIYKTGDLARRLPDGNIEFLGRIDYQVKIRGFRIELGEIENRILKYNHIEEAVVVVTGDDHGDKNLTAYIVSTGGFLESQLRVYLQENLPDYMIPSNFVRLEKIPLTPNGKIDRKALPKPGLKTGEKYTAPRNEIETKLAAIWSEVLLKTPIGIDDHFFELGGHSLKATILASRIEKTFNVKIPLAEIFRNPKIRELSKYIKDAARYQYLKVEPAEKKEYYVLSSAQKRLYFLQQMDKEGTTYNIPYFMILEGIIDKNKLEQAIRQLIQSHESLRTSFVIIDEEPVQRIHEQMELTNVFGPTFFQKGGTTEAIIKSFIRPFIRPFDLSQAPLLRVGLVKLEENRYLFLVDMHHIISDGISTRVLVQDFSDFYTGKELPGIKLQYRDYAEWQNQGRVSENILEQGKYWKKEYGGEIPVLALPTDYARPVVQVFEGDRITFEINSEISGALKTLVLELHATLYIVLLALYTILLSRLTGQEDIVIGSPIAGRRHPDLEKIIGMFVNTLALRNYPSGEKTLTGFLPEVKERTLAAFENQEFQYEDLVEQISVNRDASRNPLFDTMFEIKNTGAHKIELPGLKPVPYKYENKTAKFDLSLAGIEVEEKLSFTFEYNTKLFKRKTIENLSDYFKNMINHIISNPGVKISDVELISAETRKEQLTYLNADLKENFEVKPIQNILSDSFQKFKQNIAIEYGALRLTYAELEHRAACISQLLAENNIEKESFIGVYCKDKANIISAAIGILDRACIFVPLDANLPVKRVEGVIKLADIRVILTDTGHEAILDDMKERNPNIEHIFVIASSFYQAHELDIAKDQNIRYNSEDKVYVYFTSGTTGVPNVIVGKNESLVQFLTWEIEKFSIHEGYRISQLAAVGFDAFLRDIFVPLFVGGTVCIPGPTDMERLVDWLDSNRINLVHCVPSVFRLFNVGELTGVNFAHLKYIVMSGEPLKPNELKRWYEIFGDRIQLVNYYGTSETTMVKSYHFIRPGEVEAERIPAGLPMRGARIIILDKHLKLCGKGIVGEIYIRTPYRTYGYLNAPELNAERFIKNPLAQDDMNLLHKTGDFGKELENGEIEVLGRVDRQVKIRGVRIELENIENCLLKHDKIEKAILINRKDKNGDNYLCAYIVYKKQVSPDTGKSPSTSALREHLAKELPEYMIPSYFLPLETVPLTPNGKIDTKALALLDHEIKTDDGYIAPRNALEKKLVESWKEILGIDKELIGIDANFFQLGGHSLKVTTLLSRIHREMDVRVPLAEMFKAPTVRGLSAYIHGAAGDVSLAVEPAEAKEYYVLSSAQKRLYFLQQMDKAITAYNMPSGWLLAGEIDKNRLEQSIKKLIRRHESLRTSFHMSNDEPVQRIHDEVEFEIEKLDGRGEPLWSPFIRPFDLSHAPLLRVGLVKLAAEKHILLVDMHHIISDGTSINVLVQDFFALYTGEELPEIKVQYKDYAQWQNRARVSEKILEQGEYWKKQYEGEIPILELPVDYARLPIQSFEGNRINFEINRETSGALNMLALEAGATLYIVLLAIYTIFLAKLSSREDIVIGSPAAGRRHADLEKIIGMFVNTLTLRNSPSGEKKFADFLGEVKEQTLEAFENQEYPYEDILEQISINRNIGRNPLFDTMFVLQNFQLKKMEIPGLKLSPYEYDNKTSKFDLTLTVMEVERKLQLTFEYCTKLFKEESIERFSAYFRNIVNDIIKNKDRKISDFELITEVEKNQILFEFNNTEAIYPEDKTIHQLFEEQVKQAPDHIALVGADEGEEEKRRRDEEMNGGVETLRATSLQIQISYRQLNDQANILAGLLIEKGVLPDTIVAILSERSLELIIGITGILKSGGAYLPIDPEYPQERIDYILKDSGAKLLVTTNAKEGEKLRSWEGEKVLLEFSDRHPNQLSSHHSSFIVHHSSQLAYTIYTSGSTGKPKGVLIRHKNFVNLIYFQRSIFKEDRDSRVSQAANPAFDAMGFEVWPCMLSGAALHIVDNGIRLSPAQLRDWLIQRCITISFQPTVMAEYLLAEWWPLEGVSLKSLCAAGDELHHYPLREYPFKLYNLYGPTEDTVWTTWTVVDKETNTGISPSIGKPIANHRVYILNSNLNLQPVGVQGEIYITGIGLAQGYLNNPELTAEKFKKYRSYRSNMTYISCYKTGDLARWLPDGNIEFLGRIDRQVKIRGFRIELGEIENRLAKHPGIKDAVVITREEDKGDKYLCAYVVSNEENVIPGLREYLAKELPDYMIPSHFVRLEKIPLTPNGKIDRKILPKPELKAGESYTAPRDEIQKKLAAIWSEILGRDERHAFQLQTSIGIDDNFFEWGGHSLKATLLVSKIHKIFHVSIPLVEIFKRPTIRDISDYIKGAEKDRYTSIEPIEKKEYYALSSAQKRLYILYQMDEQGISYNIPSFSVLEGAIDKDRFEHTFKRLINRHECLRTSFHLINDEPVQKIHDDVGFEITKVFGPTFFQKGGFIRPFDLAKVPLLRVGLLKESEDKHILMVDMHHIISDGTSMNVVVEDFMALYRGEDLPVPRVQYKDFSMWQNNQRQSESIKRQEEFWIKQFEGEIPVLELPADYTRPSVQRFEGNNIFFEINKETTAVLVKLALEMGATIYIVLLALYTLLLAKISNQEDIVVGSPIAGRKHADLEKIIGMFVNTLALRNYPAGEKRFMDFLGEVKERTLKSFENQDYQYEDLVEKIPANRDTGRNPLFDAMLVLQNTGFHKIEIPGLKLVPYEYENKTSKFDLTLNAVEVADKLQLTFEYSTKLFKATTIERFIAYLKKIISDIPIDSQKNIMLAEIEIISEEEKRQILFDFNETAVPFFTAASIIELFENQFEKTPDRIAIISSHNKRLTYKDLHKRANGLGKILRDKKVGPNCIVGLMIERSIEMIVGILGILKAGGAYLPIDPDYPPGRVQYMLEDSESPLLLTRSNYAGSFNFNGEIIDIDTGCPGGDGCDLEIMNSTQDILYIIYTSGSTGKPKGVMVKIEGFLNLLHWYVEELNIGEKENILLIAPISFDLAQKNLFCSFIVGGRLILASPGIPDYYELSAIIHKEQVTLINCAPSIFYPLIELNSDTGFAQLKSLREIILGGEPIQVNKLSAWVNSKYYHCEIVNTYGPTECTDIASCFRVPGEILNQQKMIPIGKPINNVKIYILDKYLNILPVGIAGEICIGGIGLAKGYYKDTHLTEEKFIDTLHLPENKLYRTKDMGRWLADGNIEFLGRKDQQVKVRGIRMELGEVESVLLTYREIKDAIVVAKEREKGHNYLCAYIVAHKNFSLSELREHLAQHLPYYMIPSYFLQLENIPLTPSGKVDREALPHPDLIALEDNAAPRDMVEKKLVNIWAEILKIDKEKIGIDSSFFDLGGNSLHAMRLQAKIHKEFYIIFPIVEIFKSPTIRKLAAYINTSKKDGYTTINPAEEKEYYALTLSQQGLYLHLQFELESTAYNIPSITQLDGELDLRKLETVFQKLLKQHESLRTSFEMINDFPVQRIHDEVDFALEYYEPASSPGDIISNFIRPFDLAKAPLLHGGVIKNDKLKHILMLDVHHLVTDGVSQDILVNDIMTLYAGKDLPRQKIRYRDFSEWQNNEEERKRKEQDEEYWREQFDGNIPVLKLPTDYTRPPLQSFEGSTVTFEIGPEETAKLKLLALEEDVTLFMVLLSIYNILLSKLSRQEDIIVGSPTAGRPHIDLESIVGMFVMTLPIRNFPQGDKTFQVFLNEVKKSTLTAFEHQDCNIENLVKQVRMIDTGRDRLFDVLLTFQNMETLPRETVHQTHETIGLRMKPYPFKNTSAKFDLNFVIVETADRLSITLEYCSRIFKEETVQEFAEYFAAVVSIVLDNKEIMLENIDISSDLQEVTIELPETGFIF